MKNRIKLEQRIARKVHLRHQPVFNLVAQHRKVDVVGSPGVVVVTPGIGPRFDGVELVIPLIIKNKPTTKGATPASKEYQLNNLYSK